MLDYWDKAIKKYDKKGYAPVYKAMAEQLFQVITDDMFKYSWDKIKGVDAIHVEDVQYLDGYYIFPMGTNAVVQFKIEECPGWLFGIWWKEPENRKAGPFKMTGTFFAQYEKIIDKFKPSVSTIKSELQAEVIKESKCSQDKIWHISDYTDVLNQIRFIIKQPELAFCRHYQAWDYNVQYLDKRRAKKVFQKWAVWYDNKEKYSKICDDKVVDFVTDKILPLYKGAELIDRGPCWSPRYQITCKLSEYDSTLQPGHYDLDELDYELKRQWDTLNEECDKISEEHEFIWSTPVSYTIAVIDDADYESYKNLFQE